ncbi:hypothetical protein TNCV_3463171 [Trichonephila clavipes]|nr:hypothetical protein TNCV_3463171 [Trichonephila clavipes]
MPSPVQSNCDAHDTIANGQYGAVWSMGHTQQGPWNGNQSRLNKIGGHRFLFQDDIYLKNGTLSKLSKDTKRNTRFEWLRWPNGTVPYTLDQIYFLQDNHVIILIGYPPTGDFRFYLHPPPKSRDVLLPINTEIWKSHALFSSALASLQSCSQPAAALCVLSLFILCRKVFTVQTSPNRYSVLTDNAQKTPDSSASKSDLPIIPEVPLATRPDPPTNQNTA